MKITNWILLGIFVFCQPLLVAQTKFEKNTAVDLFSNPAGMDAGDLNGDNLADIAVGSGSFGVFVLLNERTSPGNWKVITVDGKFGACLTVFIVDIDNDGRKDIAAGSYSTGEIAWYRNSGDPTIWTKHLIARDFTQAHEVYAADIDLDGDQDILCAGAGNNQIAWWRNEGGDPILWTRQILTDHFLGARSVSASDLDGDGDPDVAGASLAGNELTIWKNNGGNPIQWTEVTLTNTFTGSHRVQIVDMNQDGKPDILATAYAINTIAWWENPGTIQGIWNKHVVDNNFPGAVVAIAKDFDLDGDPDIVGTAQPGNRVAWYENTGNGADSWKKSELESAFGGPWPLCIGDFDGDSDPDFAVGGNSANEIRWYRNIQEGRLTRVIKTTSGEYIAKVFLPPGLKVKTHAFIALPYTGDDLANSRLRDMMIGLSEITGGVVVVPEFPNQGFPLYNPIDNMLLNKVMEYVLALFPVFPDSVYLIGFEANGLEALRIGENTMQGWQGIIPFNPTIPELVNDQFNNYPEVPVCLCSGTLHPDRQNHLSVFNRIKNQYGLVRMVDLQNISNEVLLADLSDRLLECKNFIDTANGSATKRTDLLKEYSLRIFPNPARDFIYLEFPAGQGTSLVGISTLSGSIVMTQQLYPGGSKIQVDLSKLNLLPGIYLLTIQQGNLVWREKLIYFPHQ